MVEGFTPNEILIAQEKKAKRDKGLEEAKVYRVFLDRLRDQFSMLLVNTFGEQRILQTNEIQEETKSLKELGINSISIIKIANKAIDETNTATNAKLDLLDIFPDSGDSIVNMTPKQFMEYISDLKKQLIQE